MGSAASSLQLTSVDALTKEQVGDLVASIGPAFEAYKEAFIREGFNGTAIANLSDDEITEILNDAIGITKAYQQKNVIAQFTKLKEKFKGGSASPTKGDGGMSGAVSGAADAARATDAMRIVATVARELDMPSRLTVTPRQLMADLFALQVIPLDPSDLDMAVERIVHTVGSSGGVCDGEASYDVFINYRVAADADLAEKLYLYLKTKHIHAFLDKKCLKAGEPWKEGFLSGLSRSRKFLCLISSAALANVRNFEVDHAWDNVLLEYQTGLEIRRHLAEHDTDLARGFIVPVAVGHYSLGVLTKFMDFNPTLYPDSVGPVVEAVEAAAPAAGPGAAAAGLGAGPAADEGPRAAAASTKSPEVDLTTNEGVMAALKVQPLGEAAAEAALKALGNLCWLDTTGANAGVLVPLGAPEVVVSVLRDFVETSAFVASQGCYAMHSLARWSEESKNRLGTAGGCELAVTALTKFQSNAAVALNVCWAVINLTGGKNFEERCARISAAGGCEAVVKALRLCQANADVAQNGCWAIGNLANGSNERKDWLMAADAGAAVVAAMKLHPSEANMGSWAIRNLCMGSDDRRMKLVEAGACEAVVASLLQCASDEDAANYGCLAIISLTAGADFAGRAARVAAAGGCEAVVKALRLCHAHADVAENGCAAIGNLANGSDERKERLMAADAGAAVVAAMTQHSSVANVAQHGARAITLLCIGSENRKMKLVEAGACEAVAASLLQCAADKDAANDGCSAIINLTAGADFAGRAARIAAAGGCEAVVKALRLCHAHADVAQFGCLAIGNLANGSDERKDRLMAGEAGAAVVAAMKQHPSVANVAQFGARAIRLMCSGSVDRTVKLVEAGACEAVAASLLQCAADKDAANDGCSAIIQLTSGNDAAERKARIAAAGGCEAVVAALKESGTNIDAAYHGCWAIGNLGQNSDERKVRLAAAGACEAMAMALSRHFANVKVAEYGSWAINILSLGDGADERASRLAAAGAVEALLSVLKTWPADDKVEDACLAVKSLATRLRQRLLDGGALDALRAVTAAAATAKAAEAIKALEGN